MRPWTKRTLYLFALVLLGAQFSPPNRTNPPIDPPRTIHASMGMEPVVASALTRACNDCHSNLTIWPWYSRVAPASWLVVSDVRRGRKALNFSDWKSMDPEAQKEILSEICKEVTDRDMPTEEYLLVHPSAWLSRGEISSICAWAYSAALVRSEQAEKD